MIRSNTILYILFTTLAIIPACSGNNSESTDTDIVKINIDEKDISEFKLSEIFSDFELIRLGSGSVPLGQHRKFKIFNNKIYILDRSAIFAFSMTGEIQNLINRKGKGPEEYLSISDFTIDIDDNILVADHSGKKIVKYNSNGEYTDTWQIGFYFSGIAIYENIYYLYKGFSNMQGEFSEYMVLGYDSWKATEPNITHLSIDMNFARYMHFLDICNLRSYNGSLFLGTSGFDTLYSLSSEAIKPFYIFNYVNGKIPRSELDKEFADVKEFSEYNGDKGYSHYAFYYLDSPDFLFSRYQHAMKPYINIYDKVKISNRSTDGFTDDLFLPDTKHKIYEFYPLAYHDTWYYFLYQPYRIVEYINNNGFDKIDTSMLSKEVLESIKEDDNPVIVRFKVK